ncbi:hypothetical protein [Planomicrobium sp. CPCC 101079]|uniref:hypothetical protein n=1 Tax=Planomicrobium sp. CPCC 101079 TaxID=2599618 RepID=UPI0011B622FE|nr:hypothetical protein [Planomicrobium sp. CPCC 101079]TWT04601.1 hypothetical protein FQV28_08335 [Planomicrobium sp. CPCC 101079]
MLDHTPDWVKRKYEQAIEERYAESQQRTIESYKGLMLLADTLLNKGQGFNEILPPFAELNKEKVEAAEEQFVGGSWWKSE